MAAYQKRVQHTPSAEQLHSETTFVFDGKSKKGKAGQWAVYVDGRLHMPDVVDNRTFIEVYRRV